MTALPRRAGRRGSVRLHAELQATMQEDVGIFRDEAGLTAARGRLEELQRRAARRALPRRARRPTTPAGTSAATCATCSSSPRPWRAPRCCATRAAARTAGSTSRATTTSGASTTSSSARTRDGMRGRAAARRQGRGRSRRSIEAAQGGGAGMSARTLRAVARRRARRRARRLRGRGRDRAWSCSTRCSTIQRTPGAGPRRALELQGGEVRLVQRRGQRPAAADVQDAARPPAGGRAGHASSRCARSRSSATSSPTSRGTTR